MKKEGARVLGFEILIDIFIVSDKLRVCFQYGKLCGRWVVKKNELVACESQVFGTYCWKKLKYLSGRYTAITNDYLGDIDRWILHVEVSFHDVWLSKKFFLVTCQEE